MLDFFTKLFDFFIHELRQNLSNVEKGGADQDSRVASDLPDQLGELVDQALPAEHNPLREVKHHLGYLVGLVVDGSQLGG